MKLFALKLRRNVRTIHGFTLIELLVVIAIIGILASVVLASLNSARLKGRDSAILAEMGSFRTLYGMQFSDTGSFAPLKEGWRPAAGNCTFSGTYASQAQSICQNLVELAEGCGYASGCVYIGNTNPNSNTTYTILVALPGATASAGTIQFACLGSSGGNYVGPVNGWTGSGCYANP